MAMGSSKMSLPPSTEIMAAETSNSSAANDSLYAKKLEEYLRNTFFHNISETETQHMHDFNIFLNYIKNIVPTTNLSLSTKEEGFEDELPPYCNIRTLAAEYRRWHWHLSVFVAVLGSFTNILTILILMRKNVFFSVNFLLLGIAVADLLVSSEYVPYSLFRIIGGSTVRSSESVAYYILIRAHFSQVCHTVAIWLTAVLAIWRWFSVCRPHLATSRCSSHNAKRALLATYLACPVVASPTYLLYSVQETKNDDETIYIVNFSSLVVNSETLWTVVFFSYSAVVKLLPCLVLTAMIPVIIHGMLAVSRRRMMLKSGYETKTDLHLPVSSGAPSKQHRLKKSEVATERTTKMLVIILIIFLLAEVPQGILTGLTILYGQEFFRTCYLPLSDVMDLLALCNASVNFVVYCGMSQDFRQAFFDMIFCCRNIKICFRPDCWQKEMETKSRGVHPV